MNSRSAACFASLILAASLVACGGGGGDSRPTVSFPSQTRTGTASAGADMTVANFPVLSGDAVEALLSTIGGGEALSQPLGAGRGAGPMGDPAERRAHRGQRAGQGHGRRD